VAEAVGADGFRHVVFFYHQLADYQASVGRFVQAGLARKEPVLLAVPQPAAVLRDWPGRRAAQVTVTDMTDLGRNPARLIPALRAFGERHIGRRARIVTEFVWPGRSAAEMREAARADALLDLALADLQATLVCPYSAGLPGAALADATRAHEWELGAGGVTRRSPYERQHPGPAASRAPLPSPPAEAQTVRYRTDLRPVRAMVAAACRRAGLSVMRTTDLTIAMSELAANTLRHTNSGGTAQTWEADGELLCQIADSGHIRDPLAGVLRPDADRPGGHGLWLVNQVCDLVEVRSDEGGTIIRLHMRTRPG
jgi:anti-sigma regulatory factor (Ser/Thr protein kinase)